MHNPPSNAEPKPFVLLIIYAAFLGAGILYLGIHLSGLLDGGAPSETTARPIARILIYAAAAGFLAAGLILPRYAGAIVDEFGLGQRMIGIILRLASFEAIGIVGLMGTFWGIRRDESLGLLVFSLALILVSGVWVLALYQSLSRPAAEQNYRR